MHIFEVHSNESACRKSGGLGLEKVKYGAQQKKIMHRELKSDSYTIFLLNVILIHRNSKSSTVQHM